MPISRKVNLPTTRNRHRKADQCQEIQNRLTDGLQANSKMGSSIYTQRKTIIEQVNDQIKEARASRHFMMKRLGRVVTKWHLITASNNLLKLCRHRRSKQQAEKVELIKRDSTLVLRRYKGWSSRHK